ncbi:molybdopterin-dependent oxidoreductase [Streptomyces sp. JL4002]|uniref:molybdopterin-dependent oxidoreductase n=1 Tax=Streptomyces sp. JL4002 TaxID=3404781 RepID=UPI003B28BF79
MEQVSVRDASAPARTAAAGEGISREELALAARNHGLPLEALRYEVTPPGLHYVLVHYDIPAADPDDWRLAVRGLVRAPLSLDLAALRALPSVTHRVTMECAGNGRALLSPRPVSQPWLTGAVGTADWTGVPLHLVLAEAGVRPEAVEAVFTGADHGVERGVEQDYRRSLPVGATGEGSGVLLAHTMNGLPLPPQHGSPCGWSSPAGTGWRTSSGCARSPWSTRRSPASSSPWPTATGGPTRPRTPPVSRSPGSSRAR